MQDEKPSPAINGGGEGSAINGGGEGSAEDLKVSEQQQGLPEADDDASIRALRSSMTPSAGQDVSQTTSPRLPERNIATTVSPPNGRDALASSEPPTSPIPEIRISEHSELNNTDHENKEAVTQAPALAPDQASDPSEVQTEPLNSSMAGPAPGVEKPAAPHLSNTHDAAKDEAAKEAGPIALGEDGHSVAGDKKEAAARLEGKEAAGGFTSKRLCERWLDNLFMVLYEVRPAAASDVLHIREGFIDTSSGSVQDLRVYTIWRAEISHFKSQHMPYRKTGTEWEILGDLAQRLHHRDEAKDAYQRCLEQKFSAKAWLKLLEYYTDEGDVQRALNAAIRLATYQHRWYMETAVGRTRKTWAWR